jgi:hypothetical protein
VVGLPQGTAGTASDVQMVFDDRLLAKHSRCWERKRTLFEPIHYLAPLEWKPGGFDFAKPLEKWELPECWGSAGGSKHTAPAPHAVLHRQALNKLDLMVLDEFA